MKWPVWCEIVCSKCTDTTAGQFNRTVLNKVTLRNEALRNGWRIVAHDWLCKQCLERLKSDNSKECKLLK